MTTERLSAERLERLCGVVVPGEGTIRSASHSEVSDMAREILSLRAALAEAEAALEEAEALRAQARRDARDAMADRAREQERRMAAEARVVALTTAIFKALRHHDDRFKEQAEAMREILSAALAPKETPCAIR
jgi:hypothetical protein